MNVTVHTSGSRLRKGDVILFGEDKCIVEMVNECRARIRPLRRDHVEMTTLTRGKVEFTRPAGAFDISPNSELPILKRGHSTKNIRPKVN